MKKFFLTLLATLGLLFALSLVVTFSQGQFSLGNLINRQSRDLAVGGGFSAKSEMMSVAPMATKANISIERKVAKTGYLDILVTTAEESLNSIQVLATQLGGFVSNSNIYESSPGVKSGTVTVRVPADRFDTLMTAVKKLAIKVERENVSADDVTEQSIDLEARLKSLNIEEDQYLSLMKKADKVEDVLAITNRLSEVRGQIESLETQLKYLNSQVDMATITINLTAEKEIDILGVNWRPWLTFKQALQSLLLGLMNYVNALIAIVVVLPVLLLWLITVLVVIWLVWQIVKFSIKKKTSPKKTEVVSKEIVVKTKKAKKTSPKA